MNGICTCGLCHSLVPALFCGSKNEEINVLAKKFEKDILKHEKNIHWLMSQEEVVIKEPTEEEKAEINQMMKDLFGRDVDIFKEREDEKPND